jgi:hypothetical protein
MKNHLGSEILIELVGGAMDGDIRLIESSAKTLFVDGDFYKRENRVNKAGHVIFSHKNLDSSQAS